MVAHQRSYERRGRRRGHNEGSVFYDERRGQWVAQLDLGYVYGKRRRKSFYAKTRAEVARSLSTALANREKGHAPLSGRVTTGVFLTQWLTDVARPSVRPSTYRGYEISVRTHLVPTFGRTPLVKLAPEDVQRFMNERLHAGLTPRTVAYLRGILRHALDHAVRWGLVGRNVAALTSPPRQERPEVRPLTPEQMRVFLDGIRGDRLEAMYLVAVALGLRQGEVLGLRWEDVDLDASTLTVRVALQVVNGEPAFVEPKTRRSRRTVHLPTFVVEALRVHAGRQMLEKLALGAVWREHGLVFTSTIGTPLDGRNVTHVFQRHLARLGLPRQRFHDLRHLCASLLLAQGLTLKDVMETLGHSQISLTANLYGHLYEEQRREVARRMDALLRRPE